MGGVFAANMTGNTVLAGIALAQLDATQAWHHVTPLLAFFVGAMLARLLLRLVKSPRPCLVLEAAILAGVGFASFGREAAVMALALAMGIQASAITQFARVAVSTVVVEIRLGKITMSAWGADCDGRCVASPE